eukprot:RCo025521
MPVTSLRPYRGTRDFAPAQAPAQFSPNITRSQSGHPFVAPQAYPSVYDPRTSTGFPPIKDQANCGSCWAFATVGQLEVYLAAIYQKAFSFSEQYLTSCDTAETGCNGGWFAHDYHYNVANVGESAPGAVLTADYPYTSGVAGVNGNCVAPHHHVARLTSDIIYSSDSLDATIMQLIYTYHSVGVVIQADGSAFQNLQANAVLTLK